MLLDDTQIQFTGRWAYHLDPVIPNQFHSFHATNHTGDFAALNFTGTAIEVYGLTGPTTGNYTVKLDDQTQTFSGQAASTAQSILFSTDKLDSSKPHQLTITNQIEGRLLTVDLFNITSATSKSSSSTASKGISRGAIIAIALIAALCLLILAAALIYLLWRNRRQKSRRRTEDFARFRPITLSLPSGERPGDMEERYPWMRSTTNLNGEGSSPPRDVGVERSPYDPPLPSARGGSFGVR